MSFIKKQPPVSICGFAIFNSNKLALCQEGCAWDLRGFPRFSGGFFESAGLHEDFQGERSLLTFVMTNTGVVSKCSVNHAQSISLVLARCKLIGMNE